MDNKECKEFLSAAAMTYAPATDVPRERALIRSSLSLLITRFCENEFTKDEAIKIILEHGNLIELRNEMAYSLFKKLEDNEIIESFGKPTEIKYKIKSQFIDKVRKEQNIIQIHISKVLKELFDNGKIPTSLFPLIQQNLISSLSLLMSAYGNQYAFQIAGRAEEQILINRSDLLEFCKKSICEQVNQYITPEMMTDAIVELFERKEPHFSAFVFALTQNYFYLRLLGIHEGIKFLTEDRFTGAGFILDTNLIFAFILEESRHHRSVLELTDIATQLQISLYVTETSLDELRSLLYYHRNELSQYYDQVPDEMIPKFKNILLEAYRNNKKEKPGLSVNEFFNKFDDVRDILLNNWKIEIYDLKIDFEKHLSEIVEMKTIMTKCYYKLRKKTKSKSALHHDAHIYLLVLEERKKHGERTCWLLTLDTSLPLVAKKLQKVDEVPFCMTLDGFLQIISPYVRADHQQSFAEMFIELVEKNIMPPQDVIEIDDLRMFTGFDLTIWNLDSQDLVKIIRNVKKACNISSFSEGDRQKIAYEVQKALEDPTLISLLSG